MGHYAYVEPQSLVEAVDQLANSNGGALVIGGGTSLILLMRQRLVQPDLLIGLRRVPNLRGISPTAEGGLTIGAMETHRRVERSIAAGKYAPALTSAFGRIATVRIRNQGTVGGNLAHADPAQDPPAILMALGASVHVIGPTGERRVSLDDLFVDYFETRLVANEIIVSIELPPREPGAVAAYTKFVPRTHDDYATVSVAVSARPVDGAWRGIRVVAGAAGPTPIRLRAAEQLLEGSALEARVIGRAADAAAAEVDPIPDMRGSAAYKRDMVRVWTRRTLESLAIRAPTLG